MLLRTPAFYHQFHCIADKCTDTCCVGWEIDVDQETLDKYRKLYKSSQEGEHRHQYLKKLLGNIEDGHFVLAPGDRCPFLKQNGLCEMICELGSNGTDIGPDGDSVLGNICREHPRFVEVYGDIMEKGVGLCCEEAARLLLTHHSEESAQSQSACHPERSTKCVIKGSYLTFIETEINDEPDEMPEGAEEARDAIFKEREAIFGILNNKSIPLNQRLLEVLDFAQAVSDNEDAPICHSECSTQSEGAESSLSEQAIHQTWIEILGEGESFGPAWDAAYERMIRKGWTSPTNTSPSCLFTEVDGARIVSYMIFRYYAKSLFDGDNMTKVQFAIYFWIMLKHFADELSAYSPEGASPLTQKVNAIKLLSKQTEYSEEVMEILADNFYQNEAFSVEQFRKIISRLSSST